ncbi:MAG: bacteriohemerythrin [Spirochaetota bacterium]
MRTTTARRIATVSIAASALTAASSAAALGLALAGQDLYAALIGVSVLTLLLALAAASLTVGLVLRHRRQSARLSAEVASAKDETRDLASQLRETVLDSEASSRKLAAQIGDTLAGIARIASEGTGAHERAIALSEQVAQGATATEEIQASVESLVRHIGNQNSLVDQSAAAVEEMSANIDSVAGVARAKRDAALRLAELTERGSQTVGETERLIDEVSESVERVTGMIGIINTIAAQTNLLAMNAAIEAAHAGSYGRGFAVVAAEIRSLAETTGKNAGDIKRTLSELSTSMDDARSAGGRTGESFRSIRDEAQSVSAAFSEITTSTEELATGSTEIVNATEQLRNIAAETGTSADEMRIAAAEVTSILTTTRETSIDTSQAMESIGAAAREVSSATRRVSALSAENNDRIGELLALLDPQAVGTDDGARHRLRIANLVLEHMGWLGDVRAAIDGDEADALGLTDARSCALGAWLADAASGTIDDPQVLDRLRNAHERLHAAGERAVNLVRNGASTAAQIETEFTTVLDESRVVTEILSSYEESSVAWTPTLSVGIDVFDEHHRRLFGLIDRLYRAMRAGSSREVLGPLFDELIDYTVYHFAAEERAFAEFAFEHADEHRSRHAELVEQAQALRADLDSGKPMVAVEVMQFLRDWVTGHIQREDSRYANLLRDKPVDELLVSAQEEKR